MAIDASYDGVDLLRIVRCGLAHPIPNTTALWRWHANRPKPRDQQALALLEVAGSKFVSGP